ncbi:hypothetical protein ACIF6L_25095 [Kitasatospora sp. NPDC086009]|uniref:hypothetical protein n=1 Tax=unclassified Kitasatospora TaxID=2633591 RepID=UPI0036E51BBC
MHRRTAVVVGALLAVPTLAACGADGLTPGTAAVLDGRRIPVAAVEARVAELREVAGGASADARRPPDGLVRRAVADLVLDAVVARASADRGLAVDGAEVAAARTAAQDRYGGAGPLARVLAARGVAGPGVDDYFRRELSIRRLAAATGQDAATPAGDHTVRLALAEAALHLRVNPRYGTWNADRVALLPDTPPWLAG